MGKNSKAKRRRLGTHQTPSIVSAANERQLSSDENSDNDEEISTCIPSEEDIDVACRILQAFSRNLDYFKSKAMKQLRTQMFPLLTLQKSAYFEPEECQTPLPSDNEVIAEASNIGILTKVVDFMLTKDGRTRFLSAVNKRMRRAMHPLVMSTFNLTYCKTSMVDTDRSFSARISTALRNKHWREALQLLYDMARDGEPPKLGALQRWVRDCDVAPTTANSLSTGVTSIAPASADDATNFTSLTTPLTPGLSWLLLDAVMRVFYCESSEHSQYLTAEVDDIPLSCLTFDHVPDGLTRPTIRRFPSFEIDKGRSEDDGLRIAMRAVANEADSEPGLCRLQSSEFVSSQISVVSHVPGPLRRPPNKYDLDVITTAPNLFDLAFFRRSSLDNQSFLALPVPTPSVRRYDVPRVPGAFVLSDVFSAWACQQIIHMAECVGYVPDAVEGIDNVVWLADEALLSHVFERCRPLLPAKVGACELRGINATWRLFRYFQGSVYRPHIDGAWPGSGIRKDTGEYAQDAFDGDRFSKLTFLVYLNEGFQGGETSFYLPSLDGGIGVVNARSVRPAAGSVLCFPHGDAMGSLVHEGSEVLEAEDGGGSTRAAKYVIRTDVLYSVAP